MNFTHPMFARPPMPLFKLSQDDGLPSILKGQHSLISQGMEEMYQNEDESLDFDEWMMKDEIYAWEMFKAGMV